MAVASSPLSFTPKSQSFSALAADVEASRLYRSVRELPFELAQHVQNYYEEALFTQAYEFLFSITSNSISSINKDAPIVIPPPSHLALAATISVVPTLTTRTTISEKWDQANAALRLLRLISNIAGPINADFSAAFRFPKFAQSVSEGRGRRSRDIPIEETVEESKIDDRPNTPFADTESLWSRADDFWHVVGWAFNCSCLQKVYAARWGRWKVWLEFMLDVLEKDWNLRYPTNSIDESIIWHYVELGAGGHGRGRRILRAIFADGSSKPLNEFSEVFRHELKEPRPETTNVKKREANVDVEAEVYGDYMGQDDSDSSPASPSIETGDRVSNSRASKRVRTRTPSKRRITPRSSGGNLYDEYQTHKNNTQTASSDDTHLGGPEALKLRLRLLNLLARISAEPSLTATSPTTFPDWTEFHTLTVEFVKRLPLPTFQQILTNSGILSSSEIFLALNQSLLYSLLENSAPDSSARVVSRASLNAAIPTMEKFVTDYLPYAANKASADANARLSMVLEALWSGIVRERHSHSEAQESKDGSDDIENAVETGIQRRLGRVKESDRRKGDGTKDHINCDNGDTKEERDDDAEEEDDEDGNVKGEYHDELTAWEWLIESGQRLKWLCSGGI